MTRASDPPSSAAPVDAPSVADALRVGMERLADALAERRPALRGEEVGTVVDVGEGVARVAGLPGVRADELLRFEDGSLGLAVDLVPDAVGVVLLGETAALEAGGEVRRSGRMLDFPVGEAAIGRVLDATGAPLDGGPEIGGPEVGGERRELERPAPAIRARAPVTTPLQTGFKAIDALLPIGRGQRELILGDRQTGKSTLALDAILDQRGRDVLCVYCSVGQRAAATAKVAALLRERGALAYTTVVVAGSDDAPGLRYIAPYAATTLAEWFMARGRDVLIVYDDLTKHARAYRELSLLLRRPPGREAYPGDIFYLHSRLLERATRLTDEAGGGSLTALPIIETEAQNLSAYIPTNLISITDGQILLSPRLFAKGIVPAVEVGRSVSRVGGKAQLPAYRAVAGDLRLAYAQFEELESFSRFGAELDEATRRTLTRGRRVREVLKQGLHETLPVCDQLLVLLAATQGLFDPLPTEAVAEAEGRLRAALHEEGEAICERVAAGEELSDGDRAALLALAERALVPLREGGTSGVGAGVEDRVGTSEGKDR